MEPTAVPAFAAAALLVLDGAPVFTSNGNAMLVGTAAVMLGGIIAIYNGALTTTP